MIILCQLSQLSQNNLTALLNLLFRDGEWWGDAERGGVEDKRVGDDAVLGQFFK